MRIDTSSLKESLQSTLGKETAQDYLLSLFSAHPQRPQLSHTSAQGKQC
jgi:hypothetical protein